MRNMDAPDAHLRDEARLQRRKRRLLAKGSDVAKQLETLMNGLEVDLLNLPPPRLPDEDPLLRLRRFLDIIDRGIKACGTPAFGRCRTCGVPLDAAVLDEAPWTERCPAHRD